jgi:peptidoglycan/xylan/chitin deacetylase (PgdA/CDA1 family)
MYHRVIDPQDITNRYTQAGMSVTHSTFKKQVAFLCDKYRIISLRELVSDLREGRKPAPHRVVVTFDDGWQDNYALAFPTLKAYRAPATIFLTTGAIGANHLFWFLKVGMVIAECSEIPPALRNAAPGGTEPELDRALEALKTMDAAQLEDLADEVLMASNLSADILSRKRWMLNWDEIREMSASIDFGSHGRSHAILTRMRPQDAEAEIVESKREMEANLNRPVDFFAYPNGDYDATVRNMVERAGYQAALATRGLAGSSNLDFFALGRVGIHEGVSCGITGGFSRALFACAIHRVFPFR